MRNTVEKYKMNAPQFGTNNQSPVHLEWVKKYSSEVEQKKYRIDAPQFSRKHPVLKIDWTHYCLR